MEMLRERERDEHQIDYLKRNWSSSHGMQGTTQIFWSDQCISYVISLDYNNREQVLIMYDSRATFPIAILWSNNHQVTDFVNLHSSQKTVTLQPTGP